MAEVTQSAGLAELIEKGLMPSQKKPINQATFTCAHALPRNVRFSPFLCSL